MKLSWESHYRVLEINPISVPVLANSTKRKKKKVQLFVSVPLGKTFYLSWNSFLVQPFNIYCSLIMYQELCCVLSITLQKWCFIKCKYGCIPLVLHKNLWLLPLRLFSNWTMLIGVLFPCHLCGTGCGELEGQEKDINFLSVVHQ